MLLFHAVLDANREWSIRYALMLCHVGEAVAGGSKDFASFFFGHILRIANHAAAQRGTYNTQIYF